MLWFVFALASACFMAAGVISKVLMRENDRWTSGWPMCVLYAPFLLSLWKK